MNGTISFIGSVPWMAVAIAAVWFGWRRHSRILLALGVLMLAIAAWNIAVSLYWDW